MLNAKKLFLTALAAGILGGAGSYFALDFYLHPAKQPPAVIDLKKIIADRQVQMLSKYQNGVKMDNAGAAELTKEIKNFSEKLSSVLEKESEKRMIFVKSAVISGPMVEDITEQIAEKLK